MKYLGFEHTDTILSSSCRRMSTLASECLHCHKVMKDHMAFKKLNFSGTLRIVRNVVARGRT